jgi:RiboL-PSP-HEPN
MRSRIGAHEAVFDKIDLLSKTTQALPTEYDFVRSELCKYCCVLTCAAIDVCVEDCLLEYSERSGDVRISSYIKRQVSRARNPNIEILCGMLGSFDGKWRANLETCATESVKSAIGSIVHNRNEIAHGRTSTITFGRLGPWIKTAKDVCARIERIIFW